MHAWACYLLADGLSTAVSRVSQTEWTHLWHQCTVCCVYEWLQAAGSLGCVRLTDHCSVSHCCCSYSISYLHRYNRLPSPSTWYYRRTQSSCSMTASSIDSSIKCWSGSGASLEHVATMVNDSKAVSYTVPFFAGNAADPFSGIRERKMTGIPGCPGNGSPGMDLLVVSCTWPLVFGLFCCNVVEIGNCNECCVCCRFRMCMISFGLFPDVACMQMSFGSRRSMGRHWCCSRRIISWWRWMSNSAQH